MHKIGEITTEFDRFHGFRNMHSHTSSILEYPFLSSVNVCHVSVIMYT